MRKEKLEELKEYLNELKTIEVIKRDIENDKKFLQSEVYYFKLNNGMNIQREQLIKGNNDGSAAIIIPITVNNEILIPYFSIVAQISI